uniref:Uncharacterized protein n=1 Tax=Oryza brachyantha TaxID=4533 RepID=J3LPP1_ORYBR
MTLIGATTLSGALKFREEKFRDIQKQRLNQPIDQQNENHSPENFYFVGSTPMTKTISPTPSSRRTPSSGSNAKNKETIDVDSNDARTEKRLNWTKEEDVIGVQTK